MTTMETILIDYSGKHPGVYARGFADAGRFGIRGEGTDIEDDQRDDYYAGVAKAQEVRSIPTESPWLSAPS